MMRHQYRKTTDTEKELTNLSVLIILRLTKFKIVPRWPYGKTLSCWQNYELLIFVQFNLLQSKIFLPFLEKLELFVGYQ